MGNAVWKRPDSIDSIEKLTDLTDDDITSHRVWAEENRDSYQELMDSLDREANRRKIVKLNDAVKKAAEKK